MDKINLKIVKLLSQGMNQKEISEHFKKEGITPNSLSIIEKRLKKIREVYKAKTLFHLALILREESII
ncbi:conserved hypothetical protein [Tenacibaculum sp. 190524A05c]|uniref:helix-turn-helix transcriptional regulator n=1 Tax=Tenacibaculum platacis TaxID=3137852 RepID=UPI0031FB0E0F